MPKTDVASMQELLHGEGYNYDRAPHLRHTQLRSRVTDAIRALTAAQFIRAGKCRVLELGAGHGGFTDAIASTGAEVTVTEMSRPSVGLLTERFAHNPAVRVIYDPDGEEIFREANRYDLVLCISVLHHIPDYLRFIERVSGTIDAGGAFASFQDPLWYSRRSRLNMAADRGAYFICRFGRGDLSRGLSTRWRRLRGVYDESNPSDMVEYHVVRQGVDEEAIRAVLQPRFHSVKEWRYWSTQLPFLQSLGSRTRMKTTFGMVAQDRLP